jgi:glucan phosphoethanolaminetransferase (alkaline phosphatase superfamily)
MYRHAFGFLGLLMFLSTFGLFLGIGLGAIVSIFTKEPLLILFAMLIGPIVVNLFGFVGSWRVHSKLSQENINKINMMTAKYEMEKVEVKKKDTAEFRLTMIGFFVLFVLLLVNFIIFYFNCIEAPIVNFMISFLFFLIFMIYSLFLILLLRVKGKQRNKDIFR